MLLRPSNPKKKPPATSAVRASLMEEIVRAGGPGGLRKVTVEPREASSSPGEKDSLSAALEAAFTRMRRAKQMSVAEQEWYEEEEDKKWYDE